MKKSQTILVTGGAGYIGSACTKKLCDGGYSVVVLDNLSNSEKKYVDERAVFVEDDILDESALESVFSMHKPEVVIHFAALKAVGESEEQTERYLKNNVTGTLNLLAAAAKHKVKHFVFSSSAAVYSRAKKDRCSEEDDIGSINVYGNSKIMAEKLITEFWRTGRIPAYTIFRYFNVAGDVGLEFIEKHPQNLMPVIVCSMRDNKPVKIFGNDYATFDGTCVRDYVHLGDIVSAHIQAIEKGATGIFNLGSDKGTSVLEIVKGLSEASGKEIPYEFAPRRKGDPALILADATKAREELGWKPEHTLEDMLASVAKMI